MAALNHKISAFGQLPRTCHGGIRSQAGWQTGYNSLQLSRLQTLNAELSRSPTAAELLLPRKLAGAAIRHA
jgi:hypothetical protein